MVSALSETLMGILGCLLSGIELWLKVLKRCLCIVGPGSPLQCCSCVYCRAQAFTAVTVVIKHHSRLISPVFPTLIRDSGFVIHLVEGLLWRLPIVLWRILSICSEFYR